ncbi:MAG: STAS domain-containing protein [Spirochaetia bacterium]|nr:STAS domain-containing protein [Spirochaetia bacterium]
MDFIIKETQKGGVTILELFGGLDAHAAPQLDAKLKESLAAGKAKLVIAMAGLELISSAGWSIFIETASQYKEKGGDIRLAAMKGDAAKIFRIMGLNRIIKTFDSTAEAAASFI